MTNAESGLAIPKWPRAQFRAILKMITEVAGAPISLPPSAVKNGSELGAIAQFVYVLTRLVHIMHIDEASTT